MTRGTKFVARIREDTAFGEFAAPGRKDTDVWQAGSKLLEDVAAKANDVFDQDKPDESEEWLRQAVEIEKDVDRIPAIDGRQARPSPREHGGSSRQDRLPREYARHSLRS